MKNKIYLHWQKSIFVLALITLFSLGNSFSSYSQTPPGISINWDKEVGCQTYEIIRDKENGVFSEDIDSSDCIRFCEYSQVTYTLVNVPSGATILWNPVGGTTSVNNLASCAVNWGAAGNGSLSYTITDGANIITKTICIEKVITPKAHFDVAPFGQQPIEICSYQQIDFTNLSTTNNGTNLISYEWDFGDGNTSTAFEPSHTYTNPGGYVVKLTVRNECNCTDTYAMKVEVGEKGFEITCPTVICEGQSGIYSLPQHIVDQCNGSSNWSVIGGHIISQNNGQVEVLWDNVDPSGFGYVTFDPSQCNLPCAQPTTVKVPVIQTKGTIQGVTSICLDEQGRYKLPQWPTTEINWEILGNSPVKPNILQTDQRNEIIIDPVANGVGTFTLRATYTNTLLKCSGEAEFQFKIEEPLSVIGESVLCENGIETYTNSSGNPVNWTLKTNTGTVVTTANNTTNFSHTFSQSGNFILTADQSGYCSGEEKTITVVGTPDAPTGVDGDLLVCPNSPYTYSVQNPDASSNYYWEVDPMYGAMVGSDEGDQVNITFTSFPAEVKVYKKSITPVECISDPLTVIINQIPIDVELSDVDTAVCGNSLASYSAYDFGTQNLYTEGDDYQWSFANASGSVGASSLGSVTNGQGTNSIDVTWNNVTTTTTLDLVLNVFKCNTNTQFIRQITLYPQTEIEIVATPDPVCSGALYPVTFTVQTINNGLLSNTDQVTWNFGSGPVTTGPGVFTTTHVFPNNATAANIGQSVSAFIGNASCGQTNTANTTVTLLPNPPAIATLTSAANLFCDSADVDATITVSSNTTGVTFEWFDDNGVIPFETGDFLHVTYPSLGAGTYTFEATNPNGCVALSNPVRLFVKACDTVDCTINETVTNTSSLTGCGEITFIGSKTPGWISENWSVLGPSPIDYSIDHINNVLTGKPGNYKIIYDVEYDCLEGGGTTGTIRRVKDVVIPYEPDFSYVVECTANNTFNVDFVDNSIFYAPVTPKNFLFSYKPVNSGSFTTVSYDPIIGNFEMSNLPAGTYVFRQQVYSSLNPMYQDTCVMLDTVSLQGVDPALNILVNNGSQIECHNTAIKFDLSFTQPLGTRFLWDFNDDGAQNTLSSPERVFNTVDTTYTVSVTVTNELGCSAEFTTPVTIPERCFFGDIESAPSPAVVCQNGTVDIIYDDTGDNCAVNEYIWMDGNTPVPGGPHGATLTVNTTGFYWVKVISDNNCEYSSPTQIKPLFQTLPNVKLIGESNFCVNEDILFSVSTNVTDIKWELDNVYDPSLDGFTDVDFTGLIAGNYDVSVTVAAANGCTNTASMNFSVVSPLSAISVNETYSCTPYNVILDAIPSPSNPNITYNWSNGASTQSISVPDGGPYRVTASLGGCSISKQVDIPKNPEDYLWIYPSGCYTDCYAEKDEQFGYLIGPTLPLPSWSWNNYGSPVQTGSGSYQTPFYLMNNGVYSSTINTGHCEMESDPLDFSLERCEKCEIKDVKIEKVYQNNTPYCSFTYHVVVYSSASVPFTATISDDFNNVSIIPSSFTINPGVNNLQFTVIPQGSFSGSTNWTIQGSMFIDGQYVPCIYELRVEIPRCDNAMYGSKMIKIGDSINPQHEDLLTIYPNPAKEMATVYYEMSSSEGDLEVYDLSGRSVAKHNLRSAKGEVSLKIGKYQAGVYIVVLRQSNGHTMQQKLVIE